MSKSRGSPRKFAEKIALLNKKEAEGTSEFEKILKEVKESTREPSQPQQYLGYPQRSASFSTFGLVHESQQQHQHQHQPQYHHAHYNESQYLGATQHVQYHPSHLSHGIEQTRQHVYNTTGQSPQQHDQRQSQPPHHSHHIAQVQQRLHQPTIYIDHQEDPSNNYIHTTTNGPQVERRSSYAKPDLELPIQSISHEVPNIAIFPTDEDYQQELDVNPVAGINSAMAPNTLSDGRYHNHCSNSPISLSRSLPNIANLSVSPSTSNQIITQPIVNQRLTTYTCDSDHLKSTTSPITVMTSTDNNNDCYLQDPGGTDYVNNDEYCSLPSFQQPVLAINRQDPGRQSQSHIPPSSSWQQDPLSSTPSSAAPTPPQAAGVQGSPYGSQQHSPQQQQQQQQQQKMIQSPNSSPNRQQHSPQTLHQDYYSSPIQTQQNQLLRASSTIVINKYPTCGDDDRLGAPRINANLSKSTDDRYGTLYMDNYATGNGLLNGPMDTNGGDYSNNNQGSPYLTVNNISTSPIARSRSENNIENMNSLNDYHQFTDQYADTNQQQLLDGSQCYFNQ